MSTKKQRRRRKQRSDAQRNDAYQRRRELREVKATGAVRPSGLRLLKRILKDPIGAPLLPALVIGPISVVLGLVDHLALATFFLLAEKFGGVVALLSAAFQFGNSIWRVHPKHWTNGRYLRTLLLKEFLVGGLATLGIASVALLFEPSIAVAFTLPVAYAVVSFVYEPIETKIYLEVSRLGLKHGTEDIAGMNGLGERLEGSTTLLRKLVAWLLQRQNGNLSRMRRVIIAAMTIALLSSVLGAAAAFGALCTGHVPLLPVVPHLHNRAGAHNDQKHHRHKGKKARASSRMRGVSQQAQSSRTPPISHASTWWNDVCPTEPGYDAPSWVRRELNALYLGRAENAGPPPGAFQGGCTGQTERISSSYGPLYYTIGRSVNSGQPLSIAVVSAGYGPAIFLSPAPSLILALVAQGPLGGEPRQNVANGDLYLVHNSDGATVLIRRTKTLSTTSILAQPYVELPATAAQAWFDLIRARARTTGGDSTQAWLWPVKTDLPDGTVRFQLLDALTNAPVASITFHPRSRSAQLRTANESVTYTTPNSNFTLSDLRPFMPPPPGSSTAP